MLFEAVFDDGALILCGSKRRFRDEKSRSTFFKRKFKLCTQNYRYNAKVDANRCSDLDKSFIQHTSPKH